jgi:hypothetical protein
MYSAVLTMHSCLRWLVIVLGIWAVVSAWRQRQPDGGRPSALPGLLFSVTLDIQLLLGMLLYVALSPITMAAMQDMGGVMKNGPWRFWTVEHPAMMILAVMSAHIARPRAAGATPNRRALIWYGLALLAILVAVPWPFTPQGRPWIRW